jgi:hypothetical protein
MSRATTMAATWTLATTTAAITAMAVAWTKGTTTVITPMAAITGMADDRTEFRAF